CDRIPEGADLATPGVEVRRREPRLEAGPDLRPVPVCHRIPGRIATVPLDDLVLAKDALEGETEPLGGPSGAGVQRSALPLEPAVAEVIERVAGKQEDGLGRAGRALQGRAKPDVPDLDDPEFRGDPQVGDYAQRTLVASGEDREEERVLRAGDPREHS